MSLRSYLTIMSIATVLCWTCFLFVISTINPDLTNWLGFAMFYISLFLALAGTAAIFGFLVRFIFLRRELVHRSVLNAFRQAFLLAFVLVVALFFLAYNLFSWLNLLLLIMAASCLEYFLLNYGKHDSRSIAPTIESNNLTDEL